MSKILKKATIIFLVISLIYANLAVTLFGIISYAIDDTIQQLNTEEHKNEKELQVQTSEFYKNNMSKQETEYKESITIKCEEEFNEITVSDISTGIYNKKEDTEAEQEKILYKSTRINKNEIDNNSNIEISYLLNGKEEEVKVDFAEADDKGDVIITYPENVENIKITVTSKETIESLQELNIENTKIIEKVTDLEKINILKTEKKIQINNETEEILNKKETEIKAINYTRTEAELGIDKEQISTMVEENKVNFTITMKAENQGYDLYKNPIFILELPEEVKTTTLDVVTLSNNIYTEGEEEKKYFEIDKEFTKVLKTETGQTIIGIKLIGEQKEHTKSNDENINILLETTITANEAIPTKDSKIKIYYENENATTYNGIEKTEAGEGEIGVQFVSEPEVIIANTVQIGGRKEEFIKQENAKINVKANETNEAKITGTIINNTGATIENAKILGKTTSKIGPITGVEKVYYTEKEDVTLDIEDVKNGWTTTHTQNTKKFLIVLENFEQAQIINYNYSMYMPEKVEKDTEYVETYTLYSDYNVIKSFNIALTKEAQRFDVYEDEKIKATIGLEEDKELEIGNVFTNVITIENKTDKNILGMLVTLKIPEGLSAEVAVLTSSNNNIELQNWINERGICIIPINLGIGEQVFIKTGVTIDDIAKPITATIEYNENTIINLTNNIQFEGLARIETSVTSSKVGQELNIGDKIEYRIRLQNQGKSKVKVNVDVYKEKALNIYEIEAISITTGEVFIKWSYDTLPSYINDLELRDQEIVEIVIRCKVEEIENNVLNRMYARVTGSRIEDTVTEELINKIIAPIQEPSPEDITPDQPDTPDTPEKPTPEQPENPTEPEKPEPEKPEPENPEPEVKNGTIKGIAWLDANENGKRDKNELILNDIKVKLISTENSEVIKTVSTDNKGEYEFKDIKPGKYVLQFNYNTTKFSLTEYKKTGVAENENSDAIVLTQNGKTYAKTEVINLKEEQIEQRDIGLKLNQVFDMGITKGITKVTVTNQNEKSTYNFNSTDTAKVEIKDKYYKGSTILVEYEIAVTNKGEVEGYVKNISDKIPEGMIFNSEINTNWYQGAEGKLYCTEFANKELKPGETTAVKLILTKQIETDKVIIPVNTVNIEESFNEYLLKDREEENNTSKATLIVSIKTGAIQSYMWLILLVTLIIATGTISVIKITKDRGIEATTKEERRK